MTQDEIIRMAREAGFKVYEGAFPFEPTEDKYIGFEDNLERFAALVAAHEREVMEKEKDFLLARIETLKMDAEAEREACANVCEETKAPKIRDEWSAGQITGCSSCAAAIRARGNNK